MGVWDGLWHGRRWREDEARLGVIQLRGRLEKIEPRRRSRAADPGLEIRILRQHVDGNMMTMETQNIIKHLILRKYNETYE